MYAGSLADGDRPRTWPSSGGLVTPRRPRRLPAGGAAGAAGDRPGLAAADQPAAGDRRAGAGRDAAPCSGAGRTARLDRGRRGGPGAVQRRCSTPAATGSTWRRRPGRGRPGTWCARSACAGAGSPSTAHVSVVDTDGTACAVTDVLRLRVGGDGAGHRDLAEQLPRRARAQPGRRTRARCPAGIEHGADGGPALRRLGLAIGSPGADRITTALLQVLAAVRQRPGSGCRTPSTGRGCTSHHLDQGDPDGAAQDRGRGGPAAPAAGPAGPPAPRALDVLRWRGGTLRTGPTGALEAAGDPRRAGVVAVGD